MTLFKTKLQLISLPCLRKETLFYDQIRLVLHRELTKIEKNAVSTNAVHSSYVYVYLGNKEEPWMLRKDAEKRMERTAGSTLTMYVLSLKTNHKN